MATKRRRSGVWEYRISRAGVLDRPHYLRFRDEAEGDAYVRRIERLLDAGVVPPELAAPTRDDTLRAAVRRYRDAQAVSQSDADTLPVVLSRLPAAMLLREVSFGWATEWVSTMKREHGMAPSTIRRHVGALARALDWLAAHSEISVNPLRLLRHGYAGYTPEDARAGGSMREDQERDRRLSAEEEARIRAVLAGAKPEGRQRALELIHGEALRLLFDLALETAMRLREIYSLEWPQIDIKRRTVFLDRTKNGDKRQVPLSSVAMARLEEVRKAGDGTGRVFPWLGEHPTERELRRCTAQLSRQFARIFSAAQCDDLRFHDLRHEATSRLFERTSLSDLEIAKITGHRTTRVLMRYANLRASTLAERMW